MSTTPAPMKKQRKGVSSNSLAAAEDRLSHLPEELILRIFSLLPTETIIKTSVLSKQWKNKWKRMQNLKFDSNEHKSRFSEHVLSALLSYQNPSIQSLTIAVWRQCQTTDLAIWTAVALAKHVPKLVLRLNEVRTSVPFPDRILQHSNTLEVLKLMGKMHLKLSRKSVALNCLKELHLYNIRFDNEQSVSTLLQGCPSLENLTMDIFISSGVPTLNINVPSLKKLVFGSYFTEGERLLIKTPNLTYLDMQRLDGIRTCVIDHLPELTVAKIAHIRLNMEEDILVSLTQVHQLKLCSSIKFPISNSFSQLTSLELDTWTDVWCNLLNFMFSVSPKLETLKLVGGMYGRRSARWIQPQRVAKSLQNNLRTLYWEEIIYDGEDDRDVAIYILQNAAQLVKANFTILDPPTPTLSLVRDDTVSLLNSAVLASHECQLVIEQSKFWTHGPSKDKDPDADDFYY